MISTPSLVQPQGRLSPAEAMKVAQEAPIILRNNPRAISASPLQFLFSAPETADLWTIYENLLLSCLRTADDDAAQQCLERLTLRFGDDNPRIMAFRGLVKEAQASNGSELDKVLAEYDVILEEDPLNVVGADTRSEVYGLALTFLVAYRKEESCPPTVNRQIERCYWCSDKSR
jgi:hypothetical protein